MTSTITQSDSPNPNSSCECEALRLEIENLKKEFNKQIQEILESISTNYVSKTEHQQEIEVLKSQIQELSKTTDEIKDHRKNRKTEQKWVIDVDSVPDIAKKEKWNLDVDSVPVVQPDPIAERDRWVVDSDCLKSERRSSTSEIRTFVDLEESDKGKNKNRLAPAKLPKRKSADLTQVKADMFGLKTSEKSRNKNLFDSRKRAQTPPLFPPDKKNTYAQV